MRSFSKSSKEPATRGSCWIDQAAGTKPFWMTLQIAWSGVIPTDTKPDLVPRFPTFADLRFMAYQAIVNGARGLVFFGFPLHPAGTPADERGEHLQQVRCPMLFLQGTRDELADEALLRALVGRLDTRATLELITDADHSFHVPVRSGRRDVEVLAGLLDAVTRWAATLMAWPVAP